MAVEAAGGPAVRRGRHRVRLGRVQVVIAAFAAVALTFAGLLVGGAVGNAATYGPVCDQYGSQGIGGKYVAQNDRWGSSKPQCITPFDTGFTLSTAQGTNTNGPSGYPSIYRGCVYGYCTPSSVFPVQVASMGQVRSNYSTSGPTAGGTNQYNTAYDIWFDPNANQSGRNTGLEMMVWLNRTSWVQPVGKPYYDVNIGGTVWTIWYGKIDLPVISYVRKTATTSVTNLPIELFTRDAMLRGVVKSSWYMTSVQAGFEPWTGGTGLRTNSFSVTRNGA